MSEDSGNSPAEIYAAALDDPDVPKLYFNGYQNFASLTDVNIVLQRVDRPVGVISGSYTTVKSFAKKLLELVENAEHDLGEEFSTLDELGAKYLAKGDNE